jgi:FkbM family methyltransferase
MCDNDIIEIASSRIWHDGTAILDQILKELFQNKTGKFLGIGANIGKDWSWPLLKNGWQGILVEPDPTACAALIRNSQEFHEQLTIVNTAVSSKSALTPFYLSLKSSWNSSMNIHWLKKTMENNKHNLSAEQDDKNHIHEIVTHAIGFQDLVNYVGNKFDVIVIDTEGSDSQIVMSLDWQQFQQCTLVCIEHEFSEIDPHIDVILHLNKGGFTFTHQDNAHAIYQRHKT